MKAEQGLTNWLSRKRLELMTSSIPGNHMEKGTLTPTSCPLACTSVLVT